MRPQLLIVPKGPNQSFSVRHDTVPYFLNTWHYHCELELIYIVNGEGTQFIGDHISRFNKGDIFLIGSNLPHYWRCDDNYFRDIPELFAEARVVHFLQGIMGEDFMSMPENRNINDLLIKARQGLSITGETREKLKPFLENILDATGTKKIIYLLEVLNLLASSSQDLKLLSSSAFNNNYNKSETERLNDIYNYTMSNFKQKISQEEIASVACLSVNSFCRYFKSQTKKTYSQFLMEIRIGYACKLLIENRLTISKICLESGFNNFSNFNRYFKLITGQCPLEYKKLFSRK